MHLVDDVPIFSAAEQKDFAIELEENPLRDAMRDTWAIIEELTQLLTGPLDQ